MLVRGTARRPLCLEPGEGGRVRERTRGQVMRGLVHFGEGFGFALSEMESRQRESRQMEPRVT